MISINSIKLQLTTQNLSVIGFNVTEFSGVFNKATTDTGIDAQLSNFIVAGATRNVPVYYLEYDEVANILQLKINRFSYVTGSWEFTYRLSPYISWVHSPQNGKYLITTSENSRYAKVTEWFTQKLPEIDRAAYTGQICNGVDLYEVTYEPFSVYNITKVCSDYYVCNGTNIVCES